MEEAGILEKITRSGFCYPALNQVRKTKGEALPGEFIGNRRTHVYYKPGCPNVASISPGNRIPFNSAGAAEAAGFRPGKDCLNR